METYSAPSSQGPQIANVMPGLPGPAGAVSPWRLTSGILLLLFAGGMSIGTGLKSALGASVFSAAAAAFALVVLGAGPWSVDSWRGG